jgi:hypothetical protein
MATMFRPDSPLFVAGIGITLTIIGLGDAFTRWRNQQTIQAPITSDAAQSKSKNSTKNSEPSPWPVIGQTMLHGLSFSIAFCIILLPWTLRNERVLRVFMPIAPASASMADEFVPAGYNAWLRTWVDNWYYTEKADWPLGERPIFVEQLPAYAFDSEDEKAQVAQLLNRYNNPESKEQPTVKKVEGEDQTDQGDQVQSDDDASDDDASDDDASDDEEEDQGSDRDSSDESEDENAMVQMTPEIDAAFAQLARERIKRHPFRTYFLTPLSRARNLWFSTHSQYYPFSGDDLFPNEGEHHQKFWLPCFKGIVWIYTIFSFAGVILLWGQREARRWLLLLALLIIPRFVYLTSLQNPEPRYVVEFFPLVLACASLALAAIHRRPNP